MPRRRTTIGQGAFGSPVSFDQHAAEVLDRIVNRQLPITEDAVFLFPSQQYLPAPPEEAGDNYAD